MEENERRFTQTRTTPLRVDPLLSLLGDLADTNAADAILEGNFVAPINSDPTFVSLLPFLRRPARVEDLNIFTVESFRKGWKKMGEFTGCQGPLHFGHFKAIASDPILSEWSSLRLSRAFNSGVPAQDWLLGTDIMIEKKAGVYDMDKLRTILLFHPEFNFGNKAIGRSMMGQAERLDLMPEAQYGSRHGKSASIQVLNKVLLFELSRVQYVPLGYCSTDAKSCYDRIVHSFAALAMRRLGVPKEVTVAMFSVIKDMVRAYWLRRLGVVVLLSSHAAFSGGRARQRCGTSNLGSRQCTTIILSSFQAERRSVYIANLKRIDVYFGHGVCRRYRFNRGLTDFFLEFR
jgi:hypothetical protein